MNISAGQLAFRQLSLLILIVIVVQIASAKRNDDVVTLHNGDRMTGEIKSLERGILSFKAGYMLDSVKLDWRRVAGLESKDQYLVILTNGKYYTGKVDLVSPTGASEQFTIHSDTSKLTVPPIEVLRIRPAEENFWTQLQGSVDFGLGYTSGNDQTQASLSATAIYRREGYNVTATLDSAYSGESDSSKTNRNELALVYRKALSPKWFAGGLLDFMNSTQQSLNLRSTGGGMVGKYLKRNDRTTIALAGGMVFTHERYSRAAGPNPNSKNVEGLIGFDANTYRFKTLDIGTRLLVFPSISNPGRVRVGFKSSLRVEVVKDFFLSFNTYDAFDSRPPGIAKKNELGVSTSLGWKF